MGKIAGLALIQASVSAIGLLLTNIVWNKWQGCNIEVANKTIIYRTGLWEKCIDELVLAKSTCTPLEAEHAAGKLALSVSYFPFSSFHSLLDHSKQARIHQCIPIEAKSFTTYKSYGQNFACLWIQELNFVYNSRCV